MEKKAIVIDCSYTEFLHNVFNGVYAGNEEFEYVVLADHPMGVPSNTFRNCPNLKEIKLPNNPDLYIGGDAFNGCSQLEKVENDADRRKQDL